MMELTDRRKRISNSNSFDQSTQKENRWCKNYATDSPPSSAGDGTARVNDDRDRHWFGWRRIRRTQVLVWIIIAISFLHLRSLVPSEDSVQKIEDNTTKIKHDSSSSSSVGKSEPTTPPSIKKRTKPTRRPTTPGTDKSSPVDDSISEVAPPQTETIEEVKEEKEEKKKPPIISDSNDKKSEQKSGNHRDKKSKKSSKDKATTTKPSPLPSLSPAQTQSDGGTKSEKPKATVSDSNAKNKKGGEDTESPVESPKNNDNNPVPKATKSTKDSTSNNAQTNDKLDGGGGGITTGSESRTSKTINQGVAHSWSSNLQNPRSDADLSETASKFLETHCDLTNVKDGQWYPSGEESDWKQRAPYLIVAGVWNAGVNPLANALLKHPQIEFAKQNGFFFAKAIQTIPRCPTLRRQHKQQCHGGRNQVQRQGLRRTRTHVRTGVQQIEFSRKNWRRRPRLADDFRQQTRGYGCESGSGLLCAPDSPFDFVHHALGQNSSGAPESHRSLISAMGVQHHASRTDALVGRMDGAGNEVVADRRPDQRRWRKRGCRPVEGGRNEGRHLRKGGMESIPVGSQDGRSHRKKFVCVSTRTVDRCLRCGRKESIGGNNRPDDRRH
mmetsp:Transcript_19279/g.53765  ORF Transcript_19279/g.53765 Transcript_19279/m.53765 type:complete len:610 (-) Transcript_19279:805-2634(-)